MPPGWNVESRIRKNTRRRERRRRAMDVEDVENASRDQRTSKIGCNRIQYKYNRILLYYVTFFSLIF
jgi:hypothetical protein